MFPLVCAQTGRPGGGHFLIPRHKFSIGLCANVYIVNILGHLLLRISARGLAGVPMPTAKPIRHQTVACMNWKQAKPGATLLSISAGKCLRCQRLVCCARHKRARRASHAMISEKHGTLQQFNDTNPRNTMHVNVFHSTTAHMRALPLHSHPQGRMLPQLAKASVGGFRLRCSAADPD